MNEPLPEIISQELKAAVERCCMKHDLLFEQVTVEVLATVLGAGMLEMVEAGTMEICGFKNRHLIFKQIKPKEESK